MFYAVRSGSVPSRATRYREVRQNRSSGSQTPLAAAPSIAIPRLIRLWYLNPSAVDCREAVGSTDVCAQVFAMRGCATRSAFLTTMPGGLLTAVVNVNPSM